MSTVFKHIERGYGNILLLIPGWAADYRIFSKLDLAYDYMFPISFSPADFNKDLLNELSKKGINKISVFGWSMGGFLATELCYKNADLINNIFLISVRRKYEKDKIESIRVRIKQNKEAYLYKFYSQCFPYTMNKWFRRYMLKVYCRELELKYLLDGLDYLENAEIKPDFFKKIENIKIIHGTLDKIAPIDEALWISRQLPQVQFTHVSDSGHMPFLKENFNEIICLRRQ